MRFFVFIDCNKETSNGILGGRAYILEATAAPNEAAKVYLRSYSRPNDRKEK